MTDIYSTNAGSDTPCVPTSFTDALGALVL